MTNSKVIEKDLIKERKKQMKRIYDSNLIGPLLDAHEDAKGTDDWSKVDELLEKLNDIVEGYDD